MRFSLPLLKYRLSTDCAFSFNRTLERLGQRAGVEDSAILPVKFFAHNESGQSVDLRFGALSGVGE